MENLVVEPFFPINTTTALLAIIVILLWVLRP